MEELDLHGNTGSTIPTGGVRGIHQPCRGVGRHLLRLYRGAVQGLFFDREDWLGGYTSWPRRMVRLGHISFFGIAFINFAFTFTALAYREGRSSPLAPAHRRGVGMPLVCYLSARDRRFRHLFPIPAACIIIAVAIVLFMGVPISRLIR